MSQPESVFTPPIDVGRNSHPLVKGLITLGKLGAYLSGADLFIREQLDEVRLGKQNSGEPFALPTEHSPQVAAKIYFDRVKLAATLPVVLALRWTGADVLFRGVRQLLTRR